MRAIGAGRPPIASHARPPSQSFPNRYADAFALSGTISHLEEEREKCADGGARSVLDYLIRRTKAERHALDGE